MLETLLHQKCSLDCQLVKSILVVTIEHNPRQLFKHLFRELTSPHSLETARGGFTAIISNQRNAMQFQPMQCNRIQCNEMFSLHYAFGQFCGNVMLHCSKCMKLVLDTGGIPIFKFRQCLMLSTRPLLPLLFTTNLLNLKQVFCILEAPMPQLFALTGALHVVMHH